AGVGWVHVLAGHALQVRAQLGQQLLQRLPVAGLRLRQQLMDDVGLKHAPYYQTGNAATRGKNSLAQASPFVHLRLLGKRGRWPYGSTGSLNGAISTDTRKV